MIRAHPASIATVTDADRRCTMEQDFTGGDSGEDVFVLLGIIQLDR